MEICNEWDNIKGECMINSVNIEVTVCQGKDEYIFR